VAKLNLDGVDIEAEAGASLVEVIKNSGTFISNLCYIDGLQPYAGCRTCLVEIEGARGLQLACTSRITEGMIVRSQTAAVLDARQSVLSIINANHSDRCLTCHRRVHCQPGDICLRDDTVTHRCLTCAKNYRCELQTTNEMLEMQNIEPWLGEERTYYQSEQPEADRANPFLEFDPQMCIICTRCVRACDEIRHTGAITLAGRGFDTRIAFGAGGAIHDSNCDFCGACIDVCPTATLLEKPNKWIAKSEEWISTTCNSCSVGCTLSMGVRNGKVVMVKPDRLNPVSWDQVCVRGRFHYDAIRVRDRLSRHLVNGAPAPFDAAIAAAVQGLSAAAKNDPKSVGVLVGPWATNEEAYLAQRIARAVIGTENVDSTAGPIARAVSSAFSVAFGNDKLPSNMEDLQEAKTIVVLADDLESSHNVAALRIKDAVVNNNARIVVVSSRYGEVCDFIAPPPSGTIMPTPQKVHSAEITGVWLRPTPGGETATVAGLGSALVERLASKPANADVIGDVFIPGVEGADIDRATAILAEAAASEDNVLVVFAPNPGSATAAHEAAKAAANLAVLLRGEKAAESLVYLPTEANVIGLQDMSVNPGTGGLDLDAMLAGGNGIKALLVVGDNPMMHARERDKVEAGLRALDSLVVIDSLATETARLAHVVLADLNAYAKDGTQTTADRRIVRRARGEAPIGDQRDALVHLAALGAELGRELGRNEPLPDAEAAAVMNEASALTSGYEKATYGSLESGVTRALSEGTSYSATLQAIDATPPAVEDGRMLLTTYRTLYTSFEGASILSEEADKLHREEFLEINPADAQALGIGQNRPVVVQNGVAALELSAALTDAVPAGSVFLPLYYQGGIVNRLLHADGSPTTVSVRPA
jgi:predicted molibdopterin-dependent oxidoreductase YjgC